MSTKEKINYVVDVLRSGNGVSAVRVKFLNGEVYDLPVDKAKQLGDAGQLYGYVDHKFVPCLKCGGVDLAEYYLDDDVLYRADSAMIYNQVNCRLRQGCKLFTVKNLYVICYKGKSFVVKSNILNSGFEINSVIPNELKDGRLFVVIQGMATFNYGSVQAVYNEVLYISCEGIYCIFHSNRKRMEEIVRYYKPVDAVSTAVIDIKQRVINACIENELNKLDVTCRENVIILGNLLINLGGD